MISLKNRKVGDMSLNYQCENQMDIFDFLKETEQQNKDFPFPINLIVAEIRKEMDLILPNFPPCEIHEPEYTIWDHVKSLGYRIWFSYYFKVPYNCDPNFWCGIGRDQIGKLIPVDKLKLFCKQYGIELSIIYNPNLISFTTIETKKKGKQKYDDDDE